MCSYRRAATTAEKEKHIQTNVAPTNGEPLPTHRLFISVAGTGKQKGPFRNPQHVYAWRLEDWTGAVVCSNDHAPPMLSEGSENLGLYTAIQEALYHVPDGSRVLILAPQEEIYWVFSESAERRQVRQYRKRDGKAYAHREEIREVDRIAMQRGIVLLSRKPQDDHEVDSRYIIGDDARARLQDAKEHAAL